MAKIGYFRPKMGIFVVFVVIFYIFYIILIRDKKIKNK